MDGSLQGSESLTERNDARTWIWNEQAGRYQRTFFAQYSATTTDWRNVGRMAIGILPDDVLLDIFDFFVDESDWFEENWWCTLVHVCRKWRNIIFGSPRRLNLRLVFSDQTAVRETLDVWPPFPIVIHHYEHPKSGWGNVIAALERNDRVCRIKLKLDSQWEKVLDAMQQPFPALTRLVLASNIETAPVFPDSFLGGSAPRLQHLRLEHISIPKLPILLLSATDLVHLILRIPHSGYISPEAIVTCISTLPSLEKLNLGFESLLSRPSRDTRRPPPPTHFVLPALIMLQFTGVCEYLEDLVAQIDCPLLDCLEIVLFHQPIFDTPQLIQFISRTPTLKVYDRARMDFSDSHVRVTFPKKTSSSIYHLTVQIKCRQPERQLSSMAQICTSFFPRSFIQLVERLTIRESSNSKQEWQDNIEGRQWLELLHPFTAVKVLRLSKEFAPRIAPSLEELVGGRTTEVLPALQSIFLEKRHQSGPFEKFVAARQLSNHPVAIS
jgi:hypothetical protein